MAALESHAITPSDTVNCPGYLDLGDRAVPLLAQGRPRHARPARRDQEQLRRVLLRDGAARRHRPHRGDGASLRTGHASWRSICRACAIGFIPTREWRIGEGHAWNLGDTVVAGIGQGYIQVTPLQLATYAARVATGRQVVPHLTRKLAGELQPGSQPEDWPVLDLSERFLHVVREGMWAVVNEPGGTAPQARLADPRWQMAGQDRVGAGAAGIARAARGHQFRQLEAALGSSARMRCSSPTRRTMRRATRCRWWWSMATPAPPWRGRSRATS